LRGGGDCQAGAISWREITIPSQPLSNVGGRFPSITITPQEKEEGNHDDGKDEKDGKGGNKKK
jgi:hypothetical protein